MKNLLLLIWVGFLVAGCSKLAEESKSEQLGKEIAGQMKSPIEKARAVSEKAGKTTRTDFPE